jgi:hypothetical protein
MTFVCLLIPNLQNTAMCDVMVMQAAGMTTGAQAHKTRFLVGLIIGLVTFLIFFGLLM